MVPAVMRLSLLLLAASTLALGACKSPCRALSEKLCECSENSIQRDACVRQAANEESRVSPTAEDQDRCEALIDQCDCNDIETLEGKQACGLAR